MAKAKKKPVNYRDKVSPDPDNPGFFTVQGAQGYFRKDDAFRVAQQLTPETTLGEPGDHQAHDDDAEEEETEHRR